MLLVKIHKLRNRYFHRVISPDHVSFGLLVLFFESFRTLIKVNILLYRVRDALELFVGVVPVPVGAL